MLSSTHSKLDVQAAASYVGLSASFLNKARISGGGPAYAKLGRRIVYDPADLDAWVRQNSRRSTSEGTGHAAR